MTPPSLPPPPFPRARAELCIAMRPDAPADPFVYDPISDRGYVLNSAAIVILLHSSGWQPPLQVATLLARYFRRPINPRVVEAGWSALFRFGLVSSGPVVQRRTPVHSLPVQVIPVTEPSVLAALRASYHELSVEEDGNAGAPYPTGALAPAGV